MNQRLLLIDLGIAAVAAILILVLSPGFAISGILALLVLVVYGVSFAVRRRRRRMRYERRLRRFPH